MERGCHRIPAKTKMASDPASSRNTQNRVQELCEHREVMLSVYGEREIYFYAGRPFTCLLVVTGSQQEQNVSNSASSHDLQISQELYEHGGGTWHLRRDGSFACFLVVIGSQQQQNGFRSSFLFCQQVFGVCQQVFVLVIWVFN